MGLFDRNKNKDNGTQQKAVDNINKATDIINEEIHALFNRERKYSKIVGEEAALEFTKGYLYLNERGTFLSRFNEDIVRSVVRPAVLTVCMLFDNNQIAANHYERDPFYKSQYEKTMQSIEEIRATYETNFLKMNDISRTKK